ncbi:MAG: sigma-70 family RNA polymerase sigma factor [Bifidobacteriaceae bacterium]|jgi:RNA polymerase sigma-70 factor (ECF subfamily)|nr:sigma-70 family RNA polymerase sigma factor [Bifidobacteriaceae bacterium]
MLAATVVTAEAAPLAAIGATDVRPPATWEGIAEEYYPFVYRLAWRLTGNTPDAEDLTQETFIRVFRGLDSYKPDGSFEGWLRRITTNLFLDAKRRESRLRFEALDDEAGEVADPVAAQEDLVATLSLGEALGEALAGLSPDMRRALVMCDVEGRSYQEIADVLGVRLGTVRSRLHRARAQARNAMAEATG